METLQLGIPGIGRVKNGDAENVEKELEQFFSTILIFVEPKILDIRNKVHNDINNLYQNFIDLRDRMLSMREVILKDIKQYEEYLIELIWGSSYFEFISDLRVNAKNKDEGSNAFDKAKFYNLQLEELYDFHKKWLERIKNLSELDKLKEELKSDINNVRAAKLALEGQRTEEIYSEACEKYAYDAKFYELSFYWTLGLFAGLAICFSYIFPFSESTIIDFIFRKILLITVGVTLCTFFLRKSSHAKKQFDQAHQTSLELQALPLFINSLDKPDQDAIIKDLAMKYFGKEVDSNLVDKNGDLLQEQIKAGTELIRASADMVKVVKPSSGSASTSEPPKVSG